MTTGDELAQIILGCKRGDSECFSRVVNLYAGRCYGYFYRLTGDKEASEEMLSELFVKLVNKIGMYKGGSFDNWIFRIAANIFHDYLRGRVRHRRFLESQAAELEPDLREPKRSDATGEKIDRLQRYLAKLDEDTRELIVLRFYSGLSFREIAGIRSEPLGTVLSKLHRGLKKLRDLME